MKPWLKILIGLVLGVIFGLVTGRDYHFLMVVGRIFIDLLKMLVGIIVFASICTGICHIHDPKKLGRIGIRTLVFYFITTLVAVAFGLLLGHIIKPGAGLSLACMDGGCTNNVSVSLLDFISGIVPANPFAAFAEGNILQIIIFAVFFAYAIIMAGEKGKPILAVLESVSEVMYSLTHTIMKFAPYGVFALIATSVGSVGGRVIKPLLELLLANYIGFLFMMIIVFPLSIRLFARMRIMPYFKGMKDAFVMAFTTSSSSATLPVSLECARDHLGVSEDISGFVMSLGSTINMNGAAIGQVLAATFIAQAYGIELSFLQIGVLILTSLLSAVGAAGIPGTGIIMLSMVLNSIGLPLEGIALVAGIDRIREMGSAVINIMGDGVATLYVAKKEGKINEERYHKVTWYE
ncbi:MAG: dicarboxylate/amino acid:cation symporter [Simkaniaceae bacterium]|nr:dicarboxylate/amino acid:cation symporter [Simkaniaceae bacterium]